MDVKRRLVTGAAGFTLVEVMIASMVMTIALLPLLGIINRGILLSQKAQEKTIAMALAVEKMEQIKSFLPKTPAEFTPTDPRNNPASVLGDVIYLENAPETVQKETRKDRFKTYYRYVAVNTPAASFTTIPPNNYYTYYDMTVNVTVYWDDYESGTTIRREIKLSSELVGR